MKKIFNTGSIILIALFFVSLSPTSFAQSSTPVPTDITGPNSTVVTAVNVANADVLTQNGNKFRISFDISNGQGTQSDIKYAVLLNKREGKEVSLEDTNVVQKTPPLLSKQIVIDEKVFDKVLTLSANEVSHEDVVYAAPATLSGDYEITIQVRNSDGFPLGVAYAGKVKLTNQQDGLIIDSEHCYVQNDADVQHTHHSLNDLFVLPASGSMTATCTVKNSSKNSITVYPQFVTKKDSLFGDVVNLPVQNKEQISFKANESKSVNIRIPEAEAPGMYSVSVSLLDSTSTQITSNSFFYTYAVEGLSVSIGQVASDKNAYVKGEVAHIRAVTSEKTFNSTDSLVGRGSVEALLSDRDTGLVCAKTASAAFSNSPTNFDITLDNNCGNPQVQVTVKDGAKVVAQQSFFLNVKEPAPVTQVSKKINPYILGSVIVVLLLIVLLSYLYKRRTPPIIPTVVLFVVFSLASLLLYGTAHANFSASGYSPSGNYIFSGVPYAPNGGTVGLYVDDDPSSIWGGSDPDKELYYQTMNLDKTTYAPGENMYLSFIIQNPLPYAQGFVYQIVRSVKSTTPTTPVYVNLNDYPLVLPNTDYPIFVFYSDPRDPNPGMYYPGTIANTIPIGIAPSTPGTYYTHLFGEISSINSPQHGTTGYITLKFTVANPNQPPTVPTCTNPPSGSTKTGYVFGFTSKDPNNDTLRYNIDSDNDGATDEIIPKTGYYPSGSQGVGTYSWTTLGVKTVKAQAVDSGGHASGWASCTINIDVNSNKAPNPPVISGPVTGGSSQALTFFFKGTDPDNDNIAYEVDWDNDGTVDQRLPASGYVTSGFSSAGSNSWTTLGPKTFEARTKDTGGLVSSWATYTVTIVNTVPSNPSVTINSTPMGLNPYIGYINTAYTASYVSTDPDSNNIFYQLDDDFNGTGDTAQPVSGYVRSGTSQSKVYTFASRGSYSYNVRAADVAGTNRFSPLTGPVNPTNSAADAQSGLSGWTMYRFTIVNRPPTDPVIAGDANNNYLSATDQTFTFRSTDPDSADGDQIKYTIDWGDGSAKVVTAANASGATITMTHKYNSLGDFTIKALATDTYTSPLSSNWTSYPIHIINSSDGGLSCSGTKCGICRINGSSAPVTVEAYSDVTWTAEMGGTGAVANQSYTWSGTGSADQLTSVSFASSASTISRYYTATGGPKNAPHIALRDTSGRTVSFSCPGVDLVTPRPITLEIYSGKTEATVGAGDTSIYSGAKAALGTKIGGGMPPLTCKAYTNDSFTNHDPKLVKPLIDDPTTQANTNPRDPTNITTVHTGSTDTFDALGDYPYGVDCYDPANGHTKKSAIIHVVPAPDYQEF